jgi:hypothetical protein
MVVMFGVSAPKASAWEWQALERRPFRVYHKSSQSLRAQQVLNALLTVAPPILNAFHDTGPFPDPWIDVVLDDVGLIANGWVKVSEGKILLLQALPDTRGALQIGSYWDHLVSHEVTHYAHLRMTRESRGPLSWLPLPSRFPNRALPNFLSEGTAVWAESQQRSYGRLYDGYTSAVVQAQLQAGASPSLAELRYPYYRFPYGKAPYFYGGKLTAFMVETDSDMALRDMYARHASNVAGALAGYLLPSWGIDVAARETYGQDIPTLFEAWKKEATTRVSKTNWQQETFSAGYKQFLSIHLGALYYVRTGYHHPRPFDAMRPRYDVVRWTAAQGEVVVHRSQRPIVGMQVHEDRLFLLQEDIRAGFENHSNLGYGMSRVLQALSLSDAGLKTVAKGPIVGFAIQDNRVLYTTPHVDGEGSVLWRVQNDIAQPVGDLPVYVAEMQCFQGQLAIVAKTPRGSWDLYSLDPDSLAVAPLLQSRHAIARIWGDGQDLYFSVNAYLGYQMYRFRGPDRRLEQLTIAHHATYGVPLGDRLVVVGVTAVGEELFSLPLSPQSAFPLPTPIISAGLDLAGRLDADALDKDLATILPHRFSPKNGGPGVFGEDKLELISYHLGYSDGFTVEAETPVLSPVSVRGELLPEGNLIQASWPFFRGVDQGLQVARAQMTYQWDDWTPGLAMTWRWLDTHFSHELGLGLREGYRVRAHVSHTIGDGTLGLRWDRSFVMDRLETRRGYGAVHLTDVTGDGVEGYLLHRLFPIRQGWWSPDIFFGDVFGEVYWGTQSFGDAGVYYGAELQLEAYMSGAVRVAPYVGLVQYPIDYGVYGGVSVQLGE